MPLRIFLFPIGKDSSLTRSDHFAYHDRFHDDLTYFPVCKLASFKILSGHEN